MSFCDLIAHFFPLSWCTIVYLSKSWLIPNFGSYEESRYKHRRFLCGHMFPTHLGKHQGMQLLDCMVRFLSFIRHCQMVFQNDRAILPSHQQCMEATHKSSCRSTSLSAFGVGSVLDFTHSNRLFLIVFNLHSLMTYDVEHPFDGLIYHLAVFDEKICSDLLLICTLGYLFSFCIKSSLFCVSVFHQMCVL